MNDNDNKGINDSQFHMWRCLFALIHADNVIADEEVRYAAEVLEDIAFSDDQRHALCEDLRNAKSIAEMFKGITDVRDQAKFFKFAKDLVWVDRRYAREEKEVVLLLEAEHVKDLDLDGLAGHINFEFEDASTQTDTGSDIQKVIGVFKGTLFN